MRREDRADDERRCRTVWSLVPSLMACLLVAAGCTNNIADHDDTGDHDGISRQVAAYAERDCPEDVASAVLGDVRCGTLTVPENRDTGAGTVRLLVTSLTPSRPAADDPVVVLGADVGERPNYAGITPLAQRTGRRVIFLEQRGTGHSVPSLDCPGTNAGAGPVRWTDRTGSPEWRLAIRRSTSACFRGLRQRGVDVSAYGVMEMARDVADMITALRLPPVDLISFGSASRITFELLGSHPELVRAVVMDSPDVPGVDPRATVPGTTMTATREVLRWCADDPDCRRKHPKPTTLLRRAMASVDAQPLQLQVGTLTGSSRVVVDAPLLLRLARQTMTDGGSAGQWALPESLPTLLDAAAHRDGQVLAEALQELLGAQGPLCPGYRSKCMPVHVVDEGVYNTVICQDVAPSGAKPEPTAVPAVRRAYDDSWWWDLCHDWPVSAAHPASATPVSSDVPVLILVGGLAAPTPATALRSATAGLRNASVVVDPTGSHNVLGRPCVTELRNRWLDDLKPIATPPSCLKTRVEW